MADPKTVKVTVAHGRSVQHGKLVKIGEDPSGKPLYRTDEATYKAGEEMEMTEAEAADYRKLGFLVDPNAKPAPLPQGARVGLVSSETR